KLKASGASRLDLHELAAGTADVTLDGASFVTIHARDRLGTRSPASRASSIPAPPRSWGPRRAAWRRSRARGAAAGGPGATEVAPAGATVRRLRRGGRGTPGALASPRPLSGDRLRSREP